VIERLSAWLKGHESPHYLAAIEKEWSLPAAGNYEAKNSNYKVRLVPETTHRLSAVPSTQGVRWFHNAEESDGKVLKERIYLVSWFPTPVGEPIIDLDIDLGILLYSTYYQSLDCSKRK
jgi:hypothetical protein